MRRGRGPIFAVLLLACVAPAIHAETLYVIEQLVVSVTSAPDSSGERVASIHSGDHVDVLDREGDEVHVQLANGTEGWVKASYLSADPPLKQRLAERTTEVEKLKQDVGKLEAELTAARTAARAKAGSAVANAGTESPPAARGTSGQAPPGQSTSSQITSGQTSSSQTTSGQAPSGQTPASSPSSSRQMSSKPTSGKARSTQGAATPSAADSAPVTDSAATADSSAPADTATHEPSFFMTPPEPPARPIWHWVLGTAVVALGLGFVLGWGTLDRRIRRKYGGLRIY